MIERQTVIDQLEVTRRGGYQIRLALTIVEDGEEIEKRWHRTQVWNSTQIDETFAGVNASLVAMKAKPLGNVAITTLKNMIIAMEGVIGVKPIPPMVQP